MNDIVFSELKKIYEENTTITPSMLIGLKQRLVENIDSPTTKFAPKMTWDGLMNLKRHIEEYCAQHSELKDVERVVRILVFISIRGLHTPPALKRPGIYHKQIFYPLPSEFIDSCGSEFIGMCDDQVVTPFATPVCMGVH